MIRKCRKQDLDPDRPASEQKYCLYTKKGDRLLGRHPSRKSALKQERVIEMKKHGAKLAHLFSQDEINLIMNVVRKGLENVHNEGEESESNVPNSTENLDPEVVKIIPIEQQKAILQYAPREKLWDIIDLNNSWVDLFSKIPPDYKEHFIKRMKALAVTDGRDVEKMAEMYIKSKVKLDYLRAAVISVWNPEDLQQASEYLHNNGLVDRPLAPINLQAKLARFKRARSTRVSKLLSK